MKLQRFAFTRFGTPQTFSEVGTFFERLKQALERPSDYSEQRYLTAEPEKMRAGMKVLADGVLWNPGSGEGEYRRNLANNAWVFLG